MSLTVLNRRGAPPPVLICLDLREPVVDHGQARAVRGEAWRAPARQLLDHAREADWAVGHLLLARPTADASRWRAIPGLRPSPSEPVFYVDKSDPSGNDAFVRFIGHHGRGEVLLMGVSAASACLATALSLTLQGRAVAVARDATTASPVEWRGLEALASLPPQRSGGALRLQPVSRFLERVPELRVIMGGRR
jgi:nicotinamidase-related amidase